MSTHQHIGPQGTITCDMSHDERHDIVPRSGPAQPSPEPLTARVPPTVSEYVLQQRLAWLRKALRVATHKPHDQLGVPIEGFPVCSACGAIQTEDPPCVQCGGGAGLGHAPDCPAVAGDRSDMADALLRIYDLSMAEGISTRLDIREVARAALASPNKGEPHE